LAWGEAGIDQRRVLSVHRGSLAIGVDLAVDRVDDLDLIKTRQKDPTVAGIVSVAGSPRRRQPLHVHLTVAKGLLRVDVSRLRNYLEVAFFDFPLCGPAVSLLPCGEALAIEQHNGIRGRPAG